MHLQQNKSFEASSSFCRMHFSNETPGSSKDRSAFLFMKCSLTTITMFLIAESVTLGSREKLSKVFLLEVTALLLSRFEVVFAMCFTRRVIAEKVIGFS